jgi:imidazoleglycerol-phosphate dehydratase
MLKKRVATIHRKTKETDILLTLNLDGSGKNDIKTPVPFLNHMLEALSKHSGFDLTVKAKGDTHIDDHHTVEDIGIAFGMALDKALGDKHGISRYGHFYVPLDEALVRAVVDLSGRNYINFSLDLFVKKRIGNFDTELVEDFFRAVVDNGKFNLHLEKIHGRNSHHIVEAAFKSFARALKMATAHDAKVKGIPSTKGKI